MDQWKAKLEALKQQRAARTTPQAAASARKASTLPKNAFRTPRSCSSCASPLTATAKFCIKCGTKVDEASSPASTSSSRLARSTDKAVVTPSPVVSQRSSAETSPSPSAPSDKQALKVMVTGKGVKRVEVARSASVFEAMKEIGDTVGVSETDAKEKYVLVCDKKSLDLDATISSYNITEQSLLEFRLKGSSRVAAATARPTLTSSRSGTSSPKGGASRIAASAGVAEKLKQEVLRREAAEAAKAALEEELASLRSQLSGSSPSASSASPNDAQQLSLIRTEFRVLQMKYDAETRKLKDAERRLEQKQKELESLKARRGEAAKRVQNQAREMRMKKLETGAARLEARRKPTARNSKVARQTYVQSKQKQNQVAGLLAKIVQEMSKFEQKIREAEDARMNAENEMLEVAMYKQQSDDQYAELVHDIQDLLRTQFLPILPMVDGAPKQKLTQFQTSIEYRMKQAAGNAGAPASDTVPAAGVTPPPMPAAPAAPPLPNLLVDGAKPNPRASTLLSQIRKGTSLKRLDIEALKKEREENRRKHRQSMNILASLQATLASALDQRHKDMNLEEDEWEDEEMDEWM